MFCSTEARHQCFSARHEFTALQVRMLVPMWDQCTSYSRNYIRFASDNSSQLIQSQHVRSTSAARRHPSLSAVHQSPLDVAPASVCVYLRFVLTQRGNDSFRPFCALMTSLLFCRDCDVQGASLAASIYTKGKSLMQKKKRALMRNTSACRFLDSTSGAINVSV